MSCDTWECVATQWTDGNYKYNWNFVANQDIIYITAAEWNQVFKLLKYFNSGATSIKYNGKKIIYDNISGAEAEPERPITADKFNKLIHIFTTGITVDQNTQISASLFNTLGNYLNSLWICENCQTCEGCIGCQSCEECEENVETGDRE